MSSRTISNVKLGNRREDGNWALTDSEAEKEQERDWVATQSPSQ